MDTRANVIYSSNSCWKIEKTNIDDNLYCYSFTCPCLFKFDFTQSLFETGIIHQKLVKFDEYIYPQKSLWVIFRKDIYYHAILLSEEVHAIRDKDKKEKYMSILNIERNNAVQLNIHNFSRIYNAKTDQPLPRSLTPLLLCYFGDVSSANSRCLYLASIYNTLTENTLLHNDIIINPKFLDTMTVNHINPVIPNIIVNSLPVNALFYLCLIFFISLLFILYKIKPQSKSNTNANTNILMLIVVALILTITIYTICKNMAITNLIYKSITTMIDFNTNYHMKCHKSCNQTFKPDLRYNYYNQLLTLNDSDYNTLNIQFFQDDEFKTKNPLLLQNSLQISKNECTFNCVNEEVILVNNIYNNMPYYKLQKDYTLQLNSFNHIFFIGNADEMEKQKYHDLIIRYFTFSFV